MERWLLFSVEAEFDRAFEVVKILRVAAHGLFGIVRELSDGSAVDVLQLYNDVQRFFAGVVRAECADAEADLCAILEVIVQPLGAVKIEAVAEQQQLGLRVNAEAFVVG